MKPDTDYINDVSTDYIEPVPDETPYVFLGGTYTADWREKLIPKLNAPYYNPVVEDWTMESVNEEILAKQSCGLRLYVITPQMQGVYSIAEAVDDSNKHPDSTVFTVLREYNGQVFTDSQMKSLIAVMSMITANGGAVYEDLEATVGHINRRYGNRHGAK